MSEYDWFASGSQRIVGGMSRVQGLDHDALDRARLSRDPRFDGRFFIAVKSTGIYCRPICPSPTSKSANVLYFPNAAAAAEAGFRPCLRCRPEAAPGTPAWLGTSAAVRRALRLIHSGLLDDDSVEGLAARIGVGTRHLHRLFMRHVGASPIAVAQTHRLHSAKRLLDETPLTMTEIALAAGFGSVRRFNDVFRATYGRTPGELRALRRNHGPELAGDEVTLKLAFRQPYDWGQVRRFLASEVVLGVERCDDLGYARTILTSEGPVIISVRPVSGENALKLSVRGASPVALLQISGQARRVFDLAADPTLIEAALGADPLLAPHVRQHPGLRIPGAWDPFECAVRAIIGRGIKAKTAREQLARVVARLGQRISREAGGLTHLFPEPAVFQHANLERFGLAVNRASAVRALSLAVSEKQIDFSAPVDELTSKLGSLSGVGESTAQYVAMRALGEPDALPVADPVLRRRAARGGPSLSPRELAIDAETWRPWRSYAVMHLWCSK